ncbi:MAG: EAL domain-containing protein [Sedimenticolaceae bacterium]
MYAAKDAGRNRYAFYTEELGGNALAFLALESRLRKAIDDAELRLFYQPQFRLRDGALVGVEALVRWPGAQKLAERVEQILARHRIDGSLLEFEITESMVVKEGGMAHANLEAFNGMDIRLAIDDFGTGHSSLVNLKRFPLSRLKIDRSFVDGLGEDSSDEAITSASIALAKQLGLEVVAEGVETETQAAFLRRHDCEVVQGFLYAKPMPAAEIDWRFAQKAALGRSSA